MSRPTLSETYSRKYARKLALGHQLPVELVPMEPDFEAMGRILFELLRSCGLKPSSSVVEVDCGTGRLTCQLSRFLQQSYVGLDIHPESLQRARRLANRPEWRFEYLAGFTLPVADSSADFVCLFSVFTRLIHQESYLFLEEAFRALKPGGKALLSFLEFEIHAHWTVFENMVAHRRGAAKTELTNQFVSRDGLYAWAEATGFRVQSIWGGDQAFVPLSKPVTMSDGRIFEREGTPGQSVCVLQKPG